MYGTGTEYWLYGSINNIMSTTKEKVAIYARVSPGEDALDRLEAQLNALVKHCYDKGFDTDDRLIYTDMATASGRGIEGRPGFTRLIEDVEFGKFKTLFVWDFDRLARSPISHGYLADAMQKHKLRIMTLKGREYSSDDNILLKSIESAMATQYLFALKDGCRCHEQR